MSSNTATKTIAITLLVLMGVVMTATSLEENAIMDEIAHTPAGVSYIMEQDMRLNPEHPPLLKDLAGLAVVTWSKITKTPLRLPTDHLSWTEELNGQWNFGFAFLYDVGNNPDTIVPIARIPMIAITLLIGWMLFAWTRNRYGRMAGLFALILYTFSPTIIAHGHYVTTDVGAMGAFLLGIVTFIAFLKSPTRKNLIVAGIGFGIAQLVKFSVILLFPLFGFVGFIWIVREMIQARRRSAISDSEKGMIAEGLTWIGRFIAVGIIAAIIISALYVPHVWNYPQERQQADIAENLATHGNKIGVAAVTWAAKHSITRPIAQYGLGVLMVTQRVVGGNTTFFLGDVNNIGWKSYFPIVYIIKTPLALSFLTIISLLVALWRLKRFWKQPFTRLANWFDRNIDEIVALLFILLYWVVSIRGSLNIGVRHLLPTFPFVYFLLAGMTKQWLQSNSISLEAQNLFQIIKTFLARTFRTTGKALLIAVLIIWYASSSLSTYPFYLPYFNELVGGASEGHKYAVDSNLDWGQDMKRLAQFVDERGIDKIKVDYFGGGRPSYYLGSANIPYSREPTTGWIAISATFLKGGQANPTDNYIEQTGQQTDYYMWLASIEPEAIIGHSIFVFHIPEK